jgi:hypothetical protein
MTVIVVAALAIAAMVVIIVAAIIAIAALADIKVIDLLPKLQPYLSYLPGGHQSCSPSGLCSPSHKSTKAETTAMCAANTMVMPPSSFRHGDTRSSYHHGQSWKREGYEFPTPPPRDPS